jgi:hypothetical protein
MNRAARSGRKGQTPTAGANDGWRKKSDIETDDRYTIHMSIKKP